MNKYRIAITYGISMGVIAVIGFIIQKAIGDTHLFTYKLTGWITTALEALTVFYAVIQYKKQSGQLSLKEGLSVSLLTGLVAGLIYVLYAWLYYYWINPSALDALMENLKTDSEKEGLSPDKIQERVGFMRDFFPYFILAGGIIMTELIALFTGTVVSIFQRDK